MPMFASAGDDRARTVRRIGLGIGVLVVVGAVLHTALWFWAMAVLHDGTVAVLASPASVPGWTITAGPLRRDGWPMRVAVHVPSPSARLDNPNPTAALAWQAERLTLSVALLRPRVLLAELAGAQTLQLGIAPPIPFTASRMRAEFPLDPGVPVRSIMIEVAELRAGPPAEEVRIATLAVQTDMKPAAPAGETALAFALQTDGITLPARDPATGQAWPLGRQIERLVLDAALSGPLPRAAALVERAEAWRDGGGALELRRLDLAWGAFRLTGSATMALDGQLQPMGAATARVAGHAAALDAMTGAQLIAPRAALAAKAVLALMLRPAAEGEPPTVEVPFSLQDRTLALGRIPLVRVPPLLWPAAP